MSSFQKSIKFIFYVDGKEVDVETIPLVTDGKDGQSVSSLGRWHTGLIVPKLGIVTMGGSTFCAKKETANPPLWTVTTNDGRRITRRRTEEGLTDTYFPVNQIRRNTTCLSRVGRTEATVPITKECLSIPRRKTALPLRRPHRRMIISLPAGMMTPLAFPNPCLLNG